MNPLEELLKHGQAVWLDYIRRDMITGGGLQRLVEEHGLRGVTSNPTIFEKAIDESNQYDSTLEALRKEAPGRDAKFLCEALMVEDLRLAADVLRPLYDQTRGADGYVSLEVSPYLAHDTAASIAEARSLWRAVDRPNLMIKIPATREGIPAIEALLAEGININVTLMFSLAHYEAVANAFLRGVEKAAEPTRLASVASVFVSRIDTKVDQMLERTGTPEALSLRGKIAVANSKLIYRRFEQIFHGDRFASLRQRGVRPQRVLWGSTGTKNPAYSDVKYVEELVGPDTVNTMPPATLKAFQDHGRVRGATIREGVAESEDAIRRAKALGMDLNAVTETLQTEGVAAFSASQDKLLAALDRKVLQKVKRA